MKKENAIPSNAKSASKVQATGASKLSARYWLDRVFQNHGTGFYFAQIQHAGTRRAVCLQSVDRRDASIAAAKLYADIRLRGWEPALAALDPSRAAGQKEAVAVGDVCLALAALDMRPATVSNYSRALRWWSAQILESKPSRADFGKRSVEYRAKLDALPLARLNRAACDDVRAKFIAKAGGDVILQRRARVSLKAFLRNAKAAIAAAVKGGGITIAGSRPFDGFTVSGATATAYRSELDAAKLIRDARSELAKADPEAFRAILLALGAGLRRSEIENLKWRHVDVAACQIRVESHAGWQTKNSSSERSVDVDAGTVAALGTPADPSDAVVPPMATDAAVRWLRSKGVTAEKPLHSLRKEFGSLVFKAADLLTASRQLGHSSLAVTAEVYVETRTKAAPAIGAMLAGGEA